MLAEHFAAKTYSDVAGLCKAATLEEMEAQGWSLNPGRYVGVSARAADEFDFAERIEELQEELEVLNREAETLQEGIATRVTAMLDGLR
jgi:type I restriction enzyme M protein